MNRFVGLNLCLVRGGYIPLCCRATDVRENTCIILDQYERYFGISYKFSWLDLVSFYVINIRHKIIDGLIIILSHTLKHWKKFRKKEQKYTEEITFSDVMESYRQTDGRVSGSYQPNRWPVSNNRIGDMLIWCRISILMNDSYWYY